MTKLKVLDLFSGIGGFSLGLERTGGFETVAFCEIDSFCRRVLAKHWPVVPCYEDVTTLRGEDVGAVDVICGGFPCQDISTAGLGAGMDGARSGLWSEYARLVGELRPKFVLVENVAALLGRGLGRVLGDLAALGYDAEWHCIPASAVGAPHRRDRIWIVAYTDSQRCLVEPFGSIGDIGQAQFGIGNGGEAQLSTYSNEPRLSLAIRSRLGGFQQEKATYERSKPGGTGPKRRGTWSSEPGVGRVANGVPNLVDRLKAIGNAVVPDIPELIGNAILIAKG